MKKKKKKHQLALALLNESKDKRLFSINFRPENQTKLILNSKPSKCDGKCRVEVKAPTHVSMRFVHTRTRTTPTRYDANCSKEVEEWRKRREHMYEERERERKHAVCTRATTKTQSIEIEIIVLNVLSLLWPLKKKINPGSTDSELSATCLT